MTSILRTDHDQVIKVVGENIVTTPCDFGGSLSTGHPLWVNDTQFFMLDRAARAIQLWEGKGERRADVVIITRTNLNTSCLSAAPIYYGRGRRVYFLCRH
ncbi:MAG: hypothetical protein PF495_01075 [Spirochaetales bacterium]|nr:hypothetical protein [Spirochaetales bacterium]